METDDHGYICLNRPARQQKNLGQRCMHILIPGVCNVEATWRSGRSIIVESSFGWTALGGLDDAVDWSSGRLTKNAMSLLTNAPSLDFKPHHVGSLQHGTRWYDAT